MGPGPAPTCNTGQLCMAAEVGIEDWGHTELDTVLDVVLERACRIVFFLIFRLIVSVFLVPETPVAECRFT